MPKLNHVVKKIARTPARYEVEVVDSNIFQNGTRIGTVSPGREVYVTVAPEPGQREQFAARCKHIRNPRRKALNFVFAVFERMTPSEYLHALAREIPTRAPGMSNNPTPMQIEAETMGYGNINEYIDAVETARSERRTRNSEEG